MSLEKPEFKRKMGFFITDTPKRNAKMSEIIRKIDKSGIFKNTMTNIHQY